MVRDTSPPLTWATVVFGNFGFPGRTESSGQIIRTQEVSAAIASHEKVRNHREINYGRHKITHLLKLLPLLRRDNEIFVLPGWRMLIILGTLLTAARALKLVSARTHLVAIGGWLPRMAETRWGKFAIGGFSSVSTQLPSMTSAIERPEKKYWLPNFRNFDTSKLPPKEPSETIRLIHVSRLIKEKGVFESIETARVLEKQGANVRLSIYGPDEFDTDADRAEFHAQVAKSRDTVTYCGDLSHDEVIPMIATQDYVLFPSTFADEGFPGVIVESLIAGTPVLAICVGYIREISQRYEFGYVFHPPFPQAAAEIIMRNRPAGASESQVGDDLTGHTRAWAWFEEICLA